MLFCNHLEPNRPTIDHNYHLRKYLLYPVCMLFLGIFQHLAIDIYLQYIFQIQHNIHKFIYITPSPKFLISSSAQYSNIGRATIQQLYHHCCAFLKVDHCENKPQLLPSRPYRCLGQLILLYLVMK